jgi:hypothetical protein
MKLTFIILLTYILLFSVNLVAQDADSVEAEPDTISWFKDYDKALATATAEDRYMLIDFYTEW